MIGLLIGFVIPVICAWHLIEESNDLVANSFDLRCKSIACQLIRASIDLVVN